MELTRLEKERILDSRLKIQSVTHALERVDPSKVPNLEEVQNCLENAENSLRSALHSK